MEDVDGNKFVDLIQGLLPNILGYANAEVNDAAYERSVSGHSFLYHTPWKLNLQKDFANLSRAQKWCGLGKMALMPPLAPLGWLELIQKRKSNSLRLPWMARLVYWIHLSKCWRPSGHSRPG